MSTQSTLKHINEGVVSLPLAFEESLTVTVDGTTIIDLARKVFPEIAFQDRADAEPATAQNPLPVYPTSKVKYAELKADLDAHTADVLAYALVLKKDAKRITAVVWETSGGLYLSLLNNSMLLTLREDECEDAAGEKPYVYTRTRGLNVAILSTQPANYLGVFFERRGFRVHTDGTAGTMEDAFLLARWGHGFFGPRADALEHMTAAVESVAVWRLRVN